MFLIWRLGVFILPCWYWIVQLGHLCRLFDKKCLMVTKLLKTIYGSHFRYAFYKKIPQGVKSLPSALWMTGYVMFEAVFFYLKCVVERSVKLLHCHFKRTLGKKKYHYQVPAVILTYDSLSCISTDILLDFTEEAEEMDSIIVS